jgi:hypothetical protein
MSGTFPTSPAPASLVLHSQQPTRISTAHSLKRQVRGGTAQQWAFDLEWSALRRAELAPILAFALAQKGQYEAFTYTPPVLGSAQAAAAGTPLINGATASGRSIPTDGWAVSVTVLKAGDFIKFASHNKVYMLTADAVSNASGQATLTIEPGLYASVADNSAVTHANVPFTVAFAADTQETGLQPGVIARYACKLVEVL